MKCESCGCEQMVCARCGKDQIRSLRELWKAAAEGNAHQITYREESHYGILSPPRWRRPHDPNWYREQYEEMYPEAVVADKLRETNDLKEWDE